MHSALDVGDGRFPVLVRRAVAMDTLVTVRVDSARPADDVDAAVERALAWFGAVERACSRFDPESELSRLCRQSGVAVPVSDLLFEAVAFARAVAALTSGAFDPTVGGVQQERGLTRHYLTDAPVLVRTEPATYRDIRLDRRRRTVTPRRPLLLDLGAVAKGLAIDLAARELAAFERFAVEAGGDLFAGGTAAAATPWRVGVRSPWGDGLLGTVEVWNAAVCTSGGYERPVAAVGMGEHHIVDPRLRRSPAALASVTVSAPTALVADALSTAAMVLGPAAGARLLARQGVGAVLVRATGELSIIPDERGAPRWTPSCA